MTNPPIELENVVALALKLPPKQHLQLVERIVTSVEQELDSVPDAELELDTLLASEAVLQRNWDAPAEDSAWAHL